MSKKVKFRSKRSLNKRFKVTSQGKLAHKQAYISHLAYSKSTKQKRHLRKIALLSKNDWKRLKKININ